MPEATKTGVTDDVDPDWQIVMTSLSASGSGEEKDRDWGDQA